MSDTHDAKGLLLETGSRLTPKTSAPKPVADEFRCFRLRRSPAPTRRKRRRIYVTSENGACITFCRSLRDAPGAWQARGSSA
jgi:hypothetical protein